MTSSSTKSDFSDLSENVGDGDQALDGMQDTISWYLLQTLCHTHVASVAIQDDNKIP